jgi:N-acetylneuraminate synthase
VDPYVPAFKIGSGDITWPAILRHIARKGKPVLLATGASNLQEVQVAVRTLLEETPQVVLMQCNTNYTASLENLRHVQLNVLRTYAAMYGPIVLGLSDHTPGHASVLGAVALGARVIEKHFTDDRSRTGPDHRFSMDPASWKEMVLRARELEAALGGGVKEVEANEAETVVIQRRSIRAARDLPAGEVLREADLIALRPCPADALPPHRLEEVVGRSTRRAIRQGEHLRWIDLQ